MYVMMSVCLSVCLWVVFSLVCRVSYRYVVVFGLAQVRLKCHCGMETRVLSIDRDTPFAELLEMLRTLYKTPVTVQYRVRNHDLVSFVVSFSILSFLLTSVLLSLIHCLLLMICLACVQDVEADTITVRSQLEWFELLATHHKRVRSIIFFVHLREKILTWCLRHCTESGVHYLHLFLTPTSDPTLAQTRDLCSSVTPFTRLLWCRHQHDDNAGSDAAGCPAPNALTAALLNWQRSNETGGTRWRILGGAWGCGLLSLWRICHVHYRH